MLGDHATLLITDSSRSLQTHTLLRYKEDVIRSLIRESHSLAEPVENAIRIYNAESQSQGIEMPGELYSELRILSLSLQRNRRALHLYFEQRLGVLKEKYWQVGGNLNAGFGVQTEMRKNMFNQDEAFVKGYSELCLKFKTSLYSDPDEEQGRSWEEEQEEEGVVSLMDGFDLLSGGIDNNPPKDLFVSVRVLKNVGEVETISGARLSLTKGSQYYLPRDDVEQMVALGQVEVIE